MFSAQQKARYRQFATMERARRQLQVDPASANHEQLVDSIIQAAADVDLSRTLHRQPRNDARQEFRPAAAPMPDLVTRDGGPAHDGAATGIAASATLRMTHVPTAMAHVFDPKEHPLVAFELANHTGKDLRLRVQSCVEGYSAWAVDTEELPAHNSGQRVVLQLPTFFPDRLRGINEATRATLNVQVHDLDARGAEHRVEEHRTFRIWLLPKTTAVLWQEDPSTGEYRDLTQHLAAWVTPNAPGVMELLRQVLDHTGAKLIDSNQSGSQGIEDQVRGIFNALKKTNIAYVNSTLAVGAQDVFVQRVRLPEESIERRSANCLDGAVLYASLMEAASLEPAIALIHGHAFVGWRKEEGGEFDFLETIMTAKGTFEAAREVGNMAFERAKAAGNVNLLDIAALRSEGYLPME
jgi:hypothetical protein